jgi:death-on-curing protein
VTELRWLDLADALALHDRLLALHGGAEGVRDEGALSAALARPRQHLAYEPATGIVELAALLTAAIVRGHPFVDGNKRTGFVLGVLFLELNGRRFDASEAEVAGAVLALAAGEIDEAGYAAFLGANAAPPAHFTRG